MRIRTKPVEVDVVHLVEGTVRPAVISDHREGCGLRLMTKPGTDGNYVGITYGMYIATYPDGRNEAFRSREELIERFDPAPTTLFAGLATALAILFKRGAIHPDQPSRGQWPPLRNPLAWHAEDCPDDLRALGLTVAVHNDYRLRGKAHTFWLFTDDDDLAYKGEGLTDAEALNAVRAKRAALKRLAAS